MSPARLHVFLAREAPTAVVLRRGPSDRVCLVRWDLSRDRFEVGQWLRGRVYEHRCDLSPSGELFLSFVGQQHKPMRTWTAVSRVPYFTALALWPKGDTWGGGGLFETERRILLNHGRFEAQLAEGASLPEGMEVERLPDTPGQAEAVWMTRLERGGWKLTDPGRFAALDLDAPIRWPAELPPTWIKAAGGLRLELRWMGIGQRNGPHTVLRYALVDAGGARLELGRLDWADVSQRGDVLFARDGKLFRLKLPRKSLPALDDARELIDLGPLRFEAREPPPEAHRWPARLIRRTPRG